MIAGKQRRAATTLESTLVLVVLVLIIMCIVVFGMSVHYSQHVQCLSAEGARFASVRGRDFMRDTNNSGVTQQQIFDIGIKPYSADLNPAAIAVTVEWVNKSTGDVKPWDDSTRETRSITSGGEYISNAVRVTVTYTWSSGLFGDMTTQSRTEVPLSY